ncbi:MAG: DEAD/DEAH box helicase [Coriobacteriia bacterium]|nr:DEAD/DEAH box helicase [Coriobacteriia bacterium]
MKHFVIGDTECISATTRARGVEYFAGGRVNLVSVVSDLVRAQVKGQGASSYDVDIYLDLLDGELIVDDSDCDCPAFMKYDGPCKHVVATAYEALDFLNRLGRDDFDVLKQGGDLIQAGVKSRSKGSAAQKVTTMDKLREQSNPPAKKEKQTDQQAVDLMSRKNNLALERLGARSGAQKPLTLEAVLNWHSNHGYYLTLKVGNDRLFVVMDLNEFRQAILDELSLTFGQNNVLWLGRRAFKDSSKPLLDFFLSHYNAAVYHRYFYYNPATPKKMMMLNRSFFDDLFSALENRTFLFIDNDAKVKDKDARFKVVQEDLALTIKLVSFAEGAHLLLEGDLNVFYGIDRLHFIKGNRLITTSPAYSSACLDLLDALIQTEGRLYFHASDLPFLFTNVLPEVEPFLDVRIADGLEALAPPPLLTKIYLDATEDGGITARMEFSYGEASHLAFGDKSFSESYDRIRETLAEDLLASYMGRHVVDPGTLFMDGKDEEAVFIFATKGVIALGEIAEVYASEEFQLIKVRPSATTSVGVKVDGRLLSLDIDIDGIDFNEIARILSGYRKAKKYIRLRDGSFLSLEDDAIHELSVMLDSLDISESALARSDGHIEMDVSKSMFVDSLIRQSGSLACSRDEGLRSIVHAIEEASRASYALPNALEDVLRSYQKEGFRWLCTLEALRFGGILADDMGLGKTLQVLALLMAKKIEGRLTRPSVVICPASLVLNWAEEAKRFTPDLFVVPQLGNAEERRVTIGQLERVDVLVCSYDQMRRDVDHFQRYELDYVILDEAQMIKNQNTINARAVKKLNSANMLALTGTPIENNLAELWSIFDFLMPGYLFNYAHFQRRFEKPIVKEFDDERTEILRALVRPFILRRLKSEVLRELPPKIESILTVEMNKEQRSLYLAMLANTKKELAVKLAEATGQQGRIAVLAALTRLRQLCCDPALVYQDYRDGSAKLEACLELLTNCIEGGHRVLLFSQFTSMLDILESRLRSKLMRFFRLDGSTSKMERMKLVQSFNEGEVPIFLISLKAGGTGLNLTGADVVVHFDPWWNLSAQNQATDRTHRIGQTRSVQVFKLICKATIEERILALQERKAALAESIIQSGGNAFDALSSEELLALFDEDAV